jgi:murein endopeptidase/LysM repeat protein
LIRDLKTYLSYGRAVGKTGLLVGALSLMAFSTTAVAAAPTEESDTKGVSPAGWIEHRVIPGELLTEIGRRYAVSVAAIVRWNKLNKDRPLIKVGQQLRIKTDLAPAPREKVSYVIQKGDSWERVAKRHQISVKRLHFWNANCPEHLIAGKTLTIWTDAIPDERKLGKKRAERPSLPIVAVSDGAQSVGSPSRGKIAGAIQLPENPRLYTRRNPTHSYGSTHTIELIQQALAAFRSETGFKREVLICDMSCKYGGRFLPHDSHQSGRDVDIQLPCRPEVKEGTVPWDMSQVDWQAAWGLVKALIETDQVQYIFLSRDRQVRLYRAAQEAGESPAFLEKAIQYPRTDRVGIVRHDPGHVKHMHVRFQCGKDENRCLER